MTHTPGLAAGFLIAAAVAAGGQTARAAFVTGGPADPTSAVTFRVDQLPHGSFVVNQFAAAGVASSPGQTTGLLSVHFTTPRTTAAFTLTTVSGTHTFTAYSQDVRVESGRVTDFQITSVSGYVFAGITPDETRVEVGAGLLPDGAQLGDAVDAANAVPAPPGAVLLGIGLVGLAGFRVLRRRAGAVPAA
jgi:hypothetical protein